MVQSSTTPTYPMASRSSMELMLEAIQKMEEQPKNVPLPPALPARPTAKSRLPRPRINLPLKFHVLDNEGGQRMHTSSNSEEAMFNSCVSRRDDGDDDLLFYQEQSSGKFVEKVHWGNSFHATRDMEEAFQVEHSILVDLRMRVLKTEALLEQRTEENTFLKQQIQRFERKRQQYESKMKVMEKNWQDQLNSVQISLATQRNGPDKSRGKLGLLFGLEENHGHSEDEAFIDLKSIREFIDKEYQVASTTHLEMELQKLKQKFKEWKKDFKKKLMETKTTITKLGSTENCGSTEKIGVKLQVKEIQSKILCF